jgi:hypothetical protein
MMNEPHRPSDDELAELNAYLAKREHGEQPAPNEPGFPTGLAGELLKLAESTEPDPAFANRLEQQLHQAAKARSQADHSGWLKALWQSLDPERRTTMKRLIPVTLVGIVLLLFLWAVLPALYPSPTHTQMVLVTPPTGTPIPTSISLLTPTGVSPTHSDQVAINFTPQPIPNQPPMLPSLVNALGSGYGGSGTGNLPQSLPVSLSTQLPAGPTKINAYYRLERTPLTLDMAEQIASHWGLNAQFYMPGWLQSVTPDQVEHSYIAVEGMQNLSMWNSELSFTDLAIFPIYGGHQYPQTSLPPADQSVVAASDYLKSRGFLEYPYQVDLSQYNYGLIIYNRLLDGLRVASHSTSVKVDPHGTIGSVWVNQEEYQAVGTYPVLSAQSAWDLLATGQPSDRLSFSYYPTTDGNPEYWGRVYQAGRPAHLFGAPTYLLAADPNDLPYIQLNNLVLVGDVSGLLDYLKGNQGYIHAWGQVVESKGTRTLQLAGWEAFDEFSGYFTGTIRRTAEGDRLELSDGTQLVLPDLPADVPADIPVYAQGGRVGDTLEWFILQAHASDEGQAPPDLSQAQAVIDNVDLVYLAPSFSAMTPEIALDTAYRMLVPAWSFSGHITNTGGTDFIYQAYVQAVPAP